MTPGNNPDLDVKPFTASPIQGACSSGENSVEITKQSLNYMDVVGLHYGQAIVLLSQSRNVQCNNALKWLFWQWLPKRPNWPHEGCMAHLNSTKSWVHRVHFSNFVSVIVHMHTCINTQKARVIDRKPACTYREGTTHNPTDPPLTHTLTHTSPQDCPQQVLYLYMDIFCEQTTTPGLESEWKHQGLYSVDINQRGTFL